MMKHNVVPPTNGKVLRGFRSDDDGRTWSALFLHKDEPDPPSSVVGGYESGPLSCSDVDDVEVCDVEVDVSKHKESSVEKDYPECKRFFLVI